MRLPKTKLLPNSACLDPFNSFLIEEKNIVKAYNIIIDVVNQSELKSFIPTPNGCRLVLKNNCQTAIEFWKIGCQYFLEIRRMTDGNYEFTKLRCAIINELVDRAIIDQKHNPSPILHPIDTSQLLNSLPSLENIDVV